MNDKEIMPTVEFLPDKLDQWDLYKKDKYLIWIAGDNTNIKSNYLINELIKSKDIDNVMIDMTVGGYGHRMEYTQSDAS